MAIFAAGTAAKLLLKAKSIVRSPWFWAALLLAGTIGGTFLYLKADKKEAVAAAVQGADQKATTRTLEVDTEANRRIVDREQKFIILHDQTVKDYSHARATLQAAPADERNAQAPRLIIDTLNGLDRMRAARDPAGVPDSEVPQG